MLKEIIYSFGELIILSLLIGGIIGLLLGSDKQLGFDLLSSACVLRVFFFNDAKIDN